MGNDLRLECLPFNGEATGGIKSRKTRRGHKCKEQNFTTRVSNRAGNNARKTDVVPAWTPRRYALSRDDAREENPLKAGATTSV